jgi:hypothetical protein
MPYNFEKENYVWKRMEYEMEKNGKSAMDRNGMEKQWITGME